MAEHITKGISRLLSSTLRQCVHGPTPSLLRPHLGIGERSFPTNVIVPNRSKGTTSGSLSGSGLSKRKGPGNQDGLYGTLHLGKSNKKGKTKAKNITDVKPKNQQNTSIYLREIKSNKKINGINNKKIKGSKLCVEKSRANESFLLSLNSQQNRQENIKQKTYSPNTKRTVANTETSSIMKRLVKEMPKHGKNNSYGELTEAPVIVIPPSLATTLCAADVTGKMKKKQGMRPKNYKKSDARDGNEMDTPMGLQSNLKESGVWSNHTTSIADLDRFDYDVRGNLRDAVEARDVLLNQHLPFDESFEMRLGDFQMTDVFGPESPLVNTRSNSNSTTKAVGEFKNGSCNKCWSEDAPITGYDHLLYNEKRHRSKDYQSNDIMNKTCTTIDIYSKGVSRDSSLFPNLTPMAQVSLKQDSATASNISECQTTRGFTYDIPADNTSKGFILVDETRNNSRQTCQQPTALVPDLKIREIVSKIDSGSFQNNVDSLIQTLQTDRWESEVQKKLEKFNKKTVSQLRPNNSKISEVFSKARRNHILNTGTDQNNQKEISYEKSISMVPNNTSRISKLDALYKTNVLNRSMSPTRSCFGPILKVQPSEIINRKTNINGACNKNADIGQNEMIPGNNIRAHAAKENSLNGYASDIESCKKQEVVKTSQPITPNKASWSNKLLSTVERLQIQPQLDNKTNCEGSSFGVSKSKRNVEPHIWTSSAKLLDMKREKIDRKSKKNQHQVSDLSVKNTRLNNNALAKTTNTNPKAREESELKRELKDMYKDQFRDRFRQMQYDQVIRSRNGMTPLSSQFFSSSLTSPTETDSVNTIVYTPNNHANWLAETVQNTAKRQGALTEQKKRFKDKLRTKLTTNSEASGSNTNSYSNTTKTKPWRQGLTSLEGDKSKKEKLSQRKTMSKNHDTLEDFAARKDTSIFNELLNQQYATPKVKNLDNRLKTLDGLVTMVLERVYDSPKKKTAGKKKIQSSFDQVVMERYKQALRRYNERQQREKDERKKNKKNDKRIGYNNSDNNKKNKTSRNGTGKGRMRDRERTLE